MAGKRIRFEYMSTMHVPVAGFVFRIGGHPLPRAERMAEVIAQNFRILECQVGCGRNARVGMDPGEDYGLVMCFYCRRRIRERQRRAA